MKQTIIGQMKAKKAALLLALMLAALPAAAVPAMAQVIEDEIEQEAESGDVGIETSVTGRGDNANQCAPLLQGANTGNNQNGQGVVQYDSEAEDIELEGGSIAVSPELAAECNQKIQQSAAAATAPKAEEKKAKATAPTTPAPKAEAKAGAAEAKAAPRAEVPKAEAKAAPKQLPKTGGMGSDSLLALGAGGLLIGGGLLTRKIFL
jgi:LPXTG-motif cell wall-anchored protein